MGGARFWATTVQGLSSLRSGARAEDAHLRPSAKAGRKRKAPSLDSPLLSAADSGLFIQARIFSRGDPIPYDRDRVTPSGLSSQGSLNENQVEIPF